MSPILVSFLVLTAALFLTQISSGFVVVPNGCQHRRLGPVSSILKSSSSSLFEEESSNAANARGISSSELRKMSEARRRRRLLEEEERQSRFLTGDELHNLRKRVWNTRQELEQARSQGNTERVRELEGVIVRALSVDAEFIYHVSLERAEAAKKAGQFEQAEKFRKEAMSARKALPQFNLDGLWVGKYGEHGFEMINVTYVGDTLVAYKVTGDRNVPKGEISFTVDLSSQSLGNNLEPIELDDEAAKQWGSKYLQRFPGNGQVASEGFRNPRWLDGQLILVNKYFSFAWLPISHQVFFGRPSAELTLKLLRESRSKRQADSMIRDYLARCLEETEILEEEMEAEEGVYSRSQDYYYDKEGFFE